jgi:DNA-directed RNA polymerase subunit omega
MINPSVDELLESVDCRYTLVVEVAKRARQLIDGATPLVEEDEVLHPVSTATKEVFEGKVTYEKHFD